MHVAHPILLSFAPLQYATSEKAKKKLRQVLAGEEEAVVLKQERVEATVQSIELETDEAAYRPIPLARRWRRF